MTKRIRALPVPFGRDAVDATRAVTVFRKNARAAAAEQKDILYAPPKIFSSGFNRRGQKTYR
jgi:hypothetical protein